MTPRILVSGSVAIDLLLQYDGSFAAAIDPKSLEELSLAFVTEHFERHHGGTAANIAWALHLLGSAPLIVSTVGDDGGSYEALLRERGISTQWIERVDGRATATAIVATDSAERQITFFHPGADSAGSWPDLSEEREDIALAIVSPRDATLMMAAADWCESAEVPYLFDPGQQLSALSPDELQRAIRSSRGVIVNEYEMSLLQERTKWNEEDVLASGPQFLIVTRGDRGVRISSASGNEDIAACTPERIVNPTGAGDAFRAGLLAGLSREWNLTDASRLGNAVASYVVEQSGTLLETLDLDALGERAYEAYEVSLPPL